MRVCKVGRYPLATGSEFRVTHFGHLCVGWEAKCGEKRATAVERFNLASVHILGSRQSCPFGSYRNRHVGRANSDFIPVHSQNSSYNRSKHYWSRQTTSLPSIHRESRIVIADAEIIIHRIAWKGTSSAGLVSPSYGLYSAGPCGGRIEALGC